MHQSRFVVLVVLVVLSLLQGGLAGEQPSSPVPNLIRFSGTLHAPDGTPRTGTTGLTFAIYKDEHGGAPLWVETQNVALDDRGSYTVLLGKEHSGGVPLDLFDSGEPRWLGIQFDGIEQSTRVYFATVPFAIKSADAETLGGKPASSYMLIPSEQKGSAGDGNGATGSLSAAGLNSALESDSGVPNYVAKFLSASTLGPSLLSDTGTGVGIRVPAPEQSLDLLGRMQLRSDGWNTAGMWLRGTDTPAKVFLGLMGKNSLDQFGIYHNGVWRFIVDSNGYVGIGTIPEHRFDMTGRMRIRATGNWTPGIWLGPATGNAAAFIGQTGLTASDPIGLFHTGEWRLTVAANGNVGVGVDAQEKLDVMGRLRLRQEGTQAAGLWLGAATGPAPVFIGQTGTNSTDPVGIYHSGVWRFAIDSTGRVGIGTTQPTALLEVAGTLKLSGTGGVTFPDNTVQTSAAQKFSLSVADNSLALSTDSNGTQIRIAAAGVQSSHLASGAVDSNSIADGAVITTKIASGAVAAAQLAPSSVDSTKIADASITASKFSTGAVQAAIPDDGLPGTKLADGSVTAAKFAPGSISASMLPANSIDGTKLADAAITTAKIADAAVTSSKIAPGAISSVTILDNSLSGTKLMDASIPGNKLQSSSVTATQLADRTVTSQKLADASVSSSALQDLSVTSSKLADGSVTASKLALGGIPPSAVSGTAAILGSNNFVGDQVISGTVIASTLVVSGSAQFNSMNLGSSEPSIAALTLHNDSTSGSAYALDASSASNTGRAIYARTSSTSGSTVAVQGRADSTTGTGIEGLAYASSGATVGVHGWSNSSSGTGLLAEAVSRTGAPIGIKATTAGANGTIAISALASATTTGSATYGVRTESASNWGIGILSYASSMSGTTKGVVSKVESPQGVAGEFWNYGGGDLITGWTNISGTNKRLFRVDGAGDVWAAGVFRSNGADYAEMVAVDGVRSSYAPGDVLVISSETDRTLVLSSEPYSTAVAGVYSTQPGVLGSQHSLNDPLPSNEVPVAVVGIVPCRASTENGPIRRGDLLVTSTTLGHVMRGTDRSKMLGAIVGKALQPLENGTGTIQVLVTLQ